MHNSNIPGYKFIHKHRANTSGGGVGLYLADSFEFDETAESMFVEVDRPKERKLIVGVIYRPPKQSLQEFINDLDLLLTRISKENKKCYIMADWNIDLMKHQCHDNVSKALDFILFADDTNIFFLITTQSN